MIKTFLKNLQNLFSIECEKYGWLVGLLVVFYGISTFECYSNAKSIFIQKTFSLALVHSLIIKNISI